MRGGVALVRGDRHLDEQPLAARAGLAFGHVRHLGPDLFVLRQRSIGGPLFPSDLIEHLVGRAAKTVDRVDRPHVGHLFLVGLSRLSHVAARAARALPAGDASAPPCRRPWPPGFRLPRWAAGRPVAVRKASACSAIRWFICSAARSLGAMPSHATQVGHRLVKRLFQAQPLEPIFQHVREFAGRQAQPFVQGRPLDLLLLPLGIDSAAEEHFTEDRQVTSHVRLFKSADRTTVAGRELWRRRRHPPARPRMPPAA